MPAMLKDRGSCPVCGIDVPRLVTSLHGRMREIYTCPDHGALGYGVRDVTVQEWNQLSLPKFVAQATGPKWIQTLHDAGVGHLAAAKF
ncbi:MAG TPA: hypothetical protein VGB18_08955 [Candidatus Thermoplasmatota archaeon]